MLIEVGENGTYFMKLDDIRCCDMLDALAWPGSFFLVDYCVCAAVPPLSFSVFFENVCRG